MRLEVRRRVDDPAGWASVLAVSGHVPAAYTPSMVDYQAAYHDLSDLSMVIEDGGVPVATWVLGVKDGSPVSSGGPVFPPLFVTAAQDRTRKKVIDNCLDALAVLSATLERPSWAGEEVVTDGLSLWHRRIAERGAAVSVGYGLFTDLSWQLEALRLNVRKSYRPLLGKADLWQIDVHGPELTAETWDECRELHRAAAGRTTRSRETWDLQLRAAQAGEAFVVTLRADGPLVGFALFHHSRHEALYASAAYDRTLEDQGLPLGHVSLWRAIEHAKGLGLRWLHLGQRVYGPGKEATISLFKAGFATHTFARLRTETPV
jgi:FemAB family protein